MTESRKTGLRMWLVAVRVSAYGNVAIEAHSPEEAIKIAQRANLSMTDLEQGDDFEVSEVMDENGETVLDYEDMEGWQY